MSADLKKINCTYFFSTDIKLVWADILNIKKGKTHHMKRDIRHFALIFPSFSRSRILKNSVSFKIKGNTNLSAFEFAVYVTITCTCTSALSPGVDVVNVVVVTTLSIGLRLHHRYADLLFFLWQPQTFPWSNSILITFRFSFNYPLLCLLSTSTIMHWIIINCSHSRIHENI